MIPLACLVALMAGCDKAPGDGLAEFRKGKAELEARDLKNAVKHLSASVKECATNFEVQVTLASTCLALGDIASAEQAAAAAKELMPDSAEALLLDAEIGWMAKDFARAKKGYSAVANAKQLPAELRSQALSSRAVVELAENEFDQARLSLWRAMRLNRRNAAAWYHLGILSRDTWKFDEAALMQFTSAASCLDPKSERAHDILRNVIPALRDAVSRAAAVKPGATAPDSGSAAKLITEGEALLTKRDQAKDLKSKKDLTSKALKKFAAAYEADRFSYPAAWKYAELLAKTGKTSADVDKTLAVYSAAIDAKPMSLTTSLAAARYAIYNKRWITAAKILNHALAHDPESKQLLDLYIMALQKNGDNKTAALYQAWRKEL